MSGVAAPGGIFDGGGGAPFVDAAMREELFASRTPFGIVAAKARHTGQYGEEVRYTIAIKGEKYLLTLAHNEMREDQARSVLELLAAGHTAVGPLYLTKVTTKSKQTAWAITETPASDAEIEAYSKPSAPRVAVAAGGVPADDDIPF